MQKSDKPALRIRTIRESKGYTQEYMAEMMGICQSTYAHLESGKTKLHVDRLVQIAALLEVDVTALIDLYSFRHRNTDKGSWSAQPASIEMEPSARKVYDTLVEELRAEIRFLRSLVQPLKS